ncbi:hypothetical protein NSMM_500033 [Nitrosomonas mobilis]|uniref:Uncharacterized protein n=1 Tax=Nitrosomonas mobilis TaxID=51642 RepID=A0A1G5SGA7_9PROT|nr:hypothetical protein NSMM_500033 [Nitrosomonas mobilis]
MVSIVAHELPAPAYAVHYCVWFVASVAMLLHCVNSLQ